MLCAISGTVPECAVVSKKSGLVFEKRLLETHLETSGKCPVTGDVLTADDLIEIKRSDVAKPRPSAAQSIPGLLQAQQDEWDAVMLENFEMKQQLDLVRQELSHTMYRYDASCRVIARLMKERDDAQQALAHLGPQAAAKQVKDKKKYTGPLTSTIEQALAESSLALSEARKNRTVSASLATKEQIAKYTEKASKAPHATTAPGVLCLDHFKGTTLSGGVDSNAVLSFAGERAQQKLQGHTKAVRDVKISRTNDVVFTCSDDATVRMWADDGAAYKTVAEFNDHSQAVTSLTRHPTSKYLVSCSEDGTWVFYDVSGGAAPASVFKNDTANAKLLSCAFHPDGQLLGCGTDRAGGAHAVSIWDVRSSGKAVAPLGDAKDGKVRSLCFSENGYSLAGGLDSGVVKVWDLRKTQKTSGVLIELEDNDPQRPTPVNKVSYDLSGKYLAICTDVVKVYDAKERTQFATLRGHASTVTDCCWGDDATFMITSSMDRQVKTYAL